MSSADPTTAPVPPTLREPVNRVSERAVTFWRVSAILAALIFSIPVTIVVPMLPVHPWWAWLGVAVVWLVGLARALVMPTYRYRVHRWEVTEDAVFTRSGWISREQRIAPLSRVQTVDSHQSMLMRPFHLSTITVTTASAAGPLRIDCLDEDVALGLPLLLVESLVDLPEPAGPIRRAPCFETFLIGTKRAGVRGNWLNSREMGVLGAIETIEANETRDALVQAQGKTGRATARIGLKAVFVQPRPESEERRRWFPAAR